MKKLSRKSLVAIALVVAIGASLAIGGTLAYFTDQDSADNTFTMGNVSIVLNEKQREIVDGKKTTNLVDFEQNKVLMPIVGSAQGEKDAIGMPIAENYVDKVCTIANDGSNGAWVRFYFAIPSALDDGYETFNAGQNILHFNFGNADGATTYGNTWLWKHGDKWNYYETVIDGVNYNVYFADYKDVLPAGEETTQAIQGVYIDKGFDSVPGENGAVTYKVGNKDVDMSQLIGDDGAITITCPVYAVAVQDSGFDSADAAVTEAFGAQFNPWGGAVTNWQ